MRPILLIFCLIFTSCLSGFCASANKPKIIRTWKSADGRELKAELLDFDAVEIKIKRMTDFQIMKVPVAKFSAEDQAFVAELVHERNLDQGMTKGPYAEKITGTFVKAVSKQGLNYQIFGDPKWDGTQRYPLVIWLHGSGQSGSDNQAQMGGPTGLFTDPEHQSANPCFMIAPQCPDADFQYHHQSFNYFYDWSESTPETSANPSASAHAGLRARWSKPADRRERSAQIEG